MADPHIPQIHLILPAGTQVVTRLEIKDPDCGPKGETALAVGLGDVLRIFFAGVK